MKKLLDLNKLPTFANTFTSVAYGGVDVKIRTFQILADRVSGCLLTFYSVWCPEGISLCEQRDPSMSNEQRHWYIVRATYSREMSVKRYFDRLKVRSYIPMRYVEVEVNGRKRLMQRPVVHNLVFVRITPAWLQKIRQTVPLPIGFYYDRESREPAVVPDKEMDDFIYVTGGRFEDTQVIDLQQEQLEAGDRVRITEGIFKGVEGDYLRYKSKQRVVVKVLGLLAVATAEIPACFVEKI